MKVWYRSKIVWTAIAAAVALFGGYLAGEISKEALITGLVMDVVLVIFRAFTSKAITLTAALLACSMLVVPACSISEQYVVFERDVTVTGGEDSEAPALVAQDMLGGEQSSAAGRDPKLLSDIEGGVQIKDLLGLGSLMALLFGTDTDTE